MLSLPASVRVYLSTAPADLRRSFDGLSALVQQVFGREPLDGHLFLFLNRRRDRLKILYWDRDGLALWYKRLEAGTFQLPVDRGDAQGMELDAAQLAMLLGGIDVRSAQLRKRYARAG
jgi:transposase